MLRYQLFFSLLLNHHSSEELLLSYSIASRLGRREKTVRSGLLSTLPLRKNAPPRTPIGKHQPPPRALLPDLDHSLPRAAVAIIRPAHVLALAGQADDFAGRRLHGQLRGLHARAAGRAGRGLGGVRVVGAGGGDALHAHCGGGAVEGVGGGAAVESGGGDVSGARE